MKFCQSKKPSLKTRTSSNYKTKVSFTEKKRLENIWNFWPESFKYAIFSAIGKWHFDCLKNLPLRKRHHLTPKPRSLLQKSRLERCLEFFNRIIIKLTPLELCKFFNNTKMTFLSSKKPPFKVSFTEKKARKIFRIFDKNHGLTPLKIWKFFDNSRISFLRLKSLPLRK